MDTLREAFADGYDGIDRSIGDPQLSGTTHWFAAASEGADGEWQDASAHPHDEGAISHGRWLTPKLSCNRLAEYAARTPARDNVSTGGHSDASTEVRACRLQRHVRPHPQ